MYKHGYYPNITKPTTSKIMIKLTDQHPDGHPELDMIHVHTNGLSFDKAKILVIHAYSEKMGTIIYPKIGSYNIAKNELLIIMRDWEPLRDIIIAEALKIMKDHNIKG